ncbi:MAG TPA: glycoside hydrolase family 38 C-terminal domain-containing protein [Acidimicrobiales bacterium]|nr:glycoside hydrolase family 38 C-terminal domain-containing protein [Acidimicrobiales bacterium]
MGNVRAGRCASCGAPVLWLRPFGLGERRPVEPAADRQGDVVIDAESARFRMVVPGEPVTGRRHRLHWPCPDGGRRQAPAPGPVAVSVVAHTHWDREWYEPFESFRVRLVEVVDGVLDTLEADPAFAAFHLDGQTALVDDYLAARPGAAGRVRRLVEAGRLAVGPWETLADEFLVSGETLVRDLQRGVERALALGRVMAVGYLPDQFGHTAQLPQLLALGGISQVVVFRGVPDTVGTRFWWEAPDGTRAAAEALPLGYCNAGRLDDDAKLLLDRVLDADVLLGERRTGALLVMNGCDHLPVQPWVPAVLAQADELQDRYRFTMRRLEDHLAVQPVDGLPVVRGELRAVGDACVTPGVVSNRVDVRLATAAAERAVEGRAEPLSALFLPAAEWPEGLLRLAWGHLVRNAAHDSICACSADDVVRAVLLRASDARVIGERLAERAVRALAGAVDAPAGSPVVVNPGAHPRRGPVEVEVSSAGPCHLVVAGRPVPTQELGVSQDVELDVTAAGAGLDAVLDLFAAGRPAGHPVATWDDSEPPTITITLGPPGRDLGPLLDRLAAARAAGTEVRVRVLHPPTRRLLALPGEVPGFGWSTMTVADGAGPATAVAAGASWAANEHVRVDVASDGTLRLTTADGLSCAGLGRLVDGGDAGDVYDWSPPSEDRLVETPESVRVVAVESGPVRARLVVHRSYQWPVAVRRQGPAERTAAVVPVETRTVVDVVAGEPFVRLAVEVENRCRDHRLRMHFPLPAPVRESRAESAFAVVARPLTVPGNPIEAGQATFPSTRFVDCSDGDRGLALVHDGVAEYEVVGGGRELALTLFRSVGALSVDDGANRPSPAGPQMALAGPQLPGPFRRRLALVLHRGGWEDAELPAVAAEVLCPLDTAPATGGPPALAASGSRLAVRGAEVSAVVRSGGALHLRAVRLSSSPGDLEVDLDGGPAAGAVVDLHGEPLRPFAGGLALRPWEIVTLRLDES